MENKIQLLKRLRKIDQADFGAPLQTYHAWGPGTNLHESKEFKRIKPKRQVASVGKKKC